MGEEMHPILKHLVEDSSLSSAFDELVDFAVLPAGSKVNWVRFSDGAEVTAIGEDASGGCYLLRPDDLIVHASSEGQAGVIGCGVSDTLSLILSLPYWSDCLKFGKRRSLEDMRRVAAFAEKEMVEDVPDFMVKRSVLFGRLQLSPLVDPVAYLFSWATRPNGFATMSGDGSDEFANHIGRFTPEDKRSWKM